MRTFRPVTLSLVAALVCIVGAGCRKSSTSPVAPSTPSKPTGMGLSVQGIAIEGQFAIEVGQQLQMSAFVTKADGTVLNPRPGAGAPRPAPAG